MPFSFIRYSHYFVGTPPMPRLLPFPQFYHPAPGTLEQLPVTRHGIRRLSPFPFRPTAGPAFPTLTIRNGETGRSVHGICGLLPARCFTDGTVLPHERTLTSRLDRQERLISADGGALGKPVLLTVPGPSPVAGFADTDEDQVIFYGENHIYRLQSHAASADQYLEIAGPLVIADGHHRAYTHARLAADGREDCRYIPVVVAGADELVIGTFMRLIDGGGLSPDTLVQRLQRHGRVTPLTAAEPAKSPGHWLLAYRGDTYRLSRPANSGPGTDAGWMNQVVLPEVFGITDTRTDPRIASVDPPPVVDGKAFFDPLEYHKIKLLGFPLPRERFFSEVEAGRTLPPKSTRFEPRVPSGLLVWIP